MIAEQEQQDERNHERQFDERLPAVLSEVLDPLRTPRCLLRRTYVVFLHLTQTA